MDTCEGPHRAQTYLSPEFYSQHLVAVSGTALRDVVLGHMTEAKASSPFRVCFLLRLHAYELFPVMTSCPDVFPGASDERQTQTAALT